MIVCFTGCGHFFIETQPAPSKKIQPPKIVITPQKKEIQKNTATVHQQAKSMVQAADTLFFEGKNHLAYTKYEQTLRIDPDNIPATIGLSKCFIKENKYEQAFSTLVSIENRISHTRYASEYYYLYVQAKTTQSRWNNIQLKKVEDAYYHALPSYRKQPDLYYFMGLIYQNNYNFNRAKTFFSKVVSHGGHYKDSAYERICKIKKLEQCESCGYHEKFPLIPRLSRADMCYTLHHDLNIHELFQKNTNYEFKPQPLIAMDIANHSRKQEIEAVLLINLLGLSLFPNNSFEPEMPLTRADFAQIIFEIVNHVNPQAVDTVDFNKNLGGLADVHPSQHFFRAILFCTRQLIMPPLETGEFDPYGPVSGADALMSIRTLKQLFIQQFK
jgi:tetratricopeptide (TPR) repeat protein